MLLRRDVILRSLGLLAEGLLVVGVRAHIYVVGGAAIVVAYGARDATRDVDASFAPVDEVKRAAIEVALREGLPDDWLSDDAKIFVPVARVDPAPVVIIRSSAVEVSVASTEVLLAMKIRASRGRRDRGDLELLLREASIGSPSEAVALYEHYYPDDPLTARALPMLEVIFGGDAT